MLIFLISGLEESKTLVRHDSYGFRNGAKYFTHYHHHHQSFMELGHLLTRSGLTHLEVSLTVYHDFFCQLGNIVS